MTATSLHPFIKKLQTTMDLSEAEKTAILELPFNVREFPADVDIVSDGERPDRCVMILSGFACRYKVLPDGKRQIYSFHMAGDMPDLQTLHLKVMDHGFGTLSPTRVATVMHDALRRFLHQHQRIADVLWRDTLVDASIFREWMANGGRRDAYVRCAHLLCELFVRMRLVGLAQDNVCELPLTQEELGDAMGLSTVHVNRTLQQLRRNGLIKSAHRKIVIVDWPALQTAGQFDPTYLHIRDVSLTA